MEILSDKTMSNAALKPVKHPQGDLFVCELTDVILKDDMASMEYPFYSISKKPDRENRRIVHGDKWIEIRPNNAGRPTIYDKDLIIYIISQVCMATAKGEQTPEKVQIDPYAFLSFTQRGTGGRDYQTLSQMIERIDGTRYRTNVKTGGIMSDQWFGLLDKVSMQTELKDDGSEGRILNLEVTVSDWIRNAIQERDVLTLNPDYFRLRRPLERRLYEIARKKAGKSPRLSLETLHKLTGTQNPLMRQFRKSVVEIVKSHKEKDGFPDYSLDFEDDVLTMTPKQGFKERISPKPVKALNLRLFTHEDARQVLKGWCPRHVEEQWRAWVAKEDISVKKADDHYLAFCKTYVKKHGAAK